MKKAFSPAAARLAVAGGTCDGDAGEDEGGADDAGGGQGFTEEDVGDEKGDDGDEVEADFDTGVITDLTTGDTFTAKPFPEFIKKIIEAGGLVQYTKLKSEA